MSGSNTNNTNQMNKNLNSNSSTNAPRGSLSPVRGINSPRGGTPGRGSVAGLSQFYSGHTSSIQQVSPGRGAPMGIDPNPNSEKKRERGKSIASGKMVGRGDFQNNNNNNNLKNRSPKTVEQENVEELKKHLTMFSSRFKVFLMDSSNLATDLSNKKLTGISAGKWTSAQYEDITTISKALAELCNLDQWSDFTKREWYKENIEKKAETTKTVLALSVEKKRADERQQLASFLKSLTPFQQNVATFIIDKKKKAAVLAQRHVMDVHSINILNSGVLEGELDNYANKEEPTDAQKLVKEEQNIEDLWNDLNNFLGETQLTTPILKKNNVPNIKILVSENIDAYQQGLNALCASLSRSKNNLLELHPTVTNQGMQAFNTFSTLLGALAIQINAINDALALIKGQRIENKIKQQERNASIIPYANELRAWVAKLSEISTQKEQADQTSKYAVSKNAIEQDQKINLKKAMADHVNAMLGVNDQPLAAQFIITHANKVIKFAKEIISNINSTIEDMQNAGNIIKLTQDIIQSQQLIATGEELKNKLELIAIQTMYAKGLELEQDKQTQNRNNNNNQGIKAEVNRVVTINPATFDEDCAAAHVTLENSIKPIFALFNDFCKKVSENTLEVKKVKESLKGIFEKMVESSELGEWAFLGFAAAAEGGAKKTEGFMSGSVNENPLERMERQAQFNKKKTDAYTKFCNQLPEGQRCIVNAILIQRQGSMKGKDALWDAAIEEVNALSGVRVESDSFTTLIAALSQEIYKCGNKETKTELKAELQAIALEAICAGGMSKAFEPKSPNNNASFSIFKEGKNVGGGNLSPTNS